MDDRWPDLMLQAGPLRMGERFEVYGTVQGVGFRPFVHRLATQLQLDGSVRNAGGYVVVEAGGTETHLAEFARRLTDDAPPLAHVSGVTEQRLATAPGAGSGFRVAPSHQCGARAARDLPPDVATCDDCLHELRDPADRRYRYAFTNCTNCGPRATIISDLPYDRVRTVMRSFPMCADCAREYADPADRRFHAEPVACAACGPQLVWRPAYPTPVTVDGDEAMHAAARAIARGEIVAVKGLGGYQLVCDATNTDAVATLRERKGRPAKPFAVMVASLSALSEIAIATPAEKTLLTSRARPIVLLLSTGHLADVVHPGTTRIGVFLPYTPLHHLLLSELRRPLIVTSGNRHDEPMIIDDDHAVEALTGIADGFLQHNRVIAVRYDDSVLQIVADRRLMMRRARGYAPVALALPVPAATPMVAVGAELKHTFTLANADRAVVGPHTGDLEDVESFDSFQRTLAHLSRLEQIEPELVVHDLHPGYLSTQYAMRFPARSRVPVQHHHAHVAACAAEFGLTERFIGVAYDGLGLGTDGTLWGGEVLIADLCGFRRFGRFSRAPLPGGQAAVRRPARMALGYLLGSEGFDGSGGSITPTLTDAFVQRLDPREVAAVRRLVATGFNSPQASSAGRLFDAVASLLGICDDAGYEGEAAIMLESTAAPGDRGELAWSLRQSDDLLVYDVRSTLADVVRSVAENVPSAIVAARFHQTIVAVTVAMCEKARVQSGLRTVCLGGGVFQNRKLTRGVIQTLTADGFHVFIGEQVPANDGGISFGQAAIGAARSRKD
jgi:hydrogenase maturation protein HypF